MSAFMPEASSPLRLLVIEDDRDDVLLLQETLPSGYDMTVIKSLDELEAGAIDPHRFELVLLDLSLPGMRGLVTLERAQASLKDLPIIVLTGYDDEQLARDSIALGAQDFVSKRDLMAMRGDRLRRVLGYAIERHGLRMELDQAMSELSARERLFRGLADHASDVIFRLRLRPELHYDYINPAIEQLTGFPPEAFVEDAAVFTGRIHRDDGGPLQAVYEMTDAELGRPRTFRYLHRDGHWVHIEQSLQAIRDRYGVTVAVQGIARDVSEREMAHVALQTALAEQQAAVEQLKAQKLEAIGRLAAGIAHELNTPIQYVSDNVQFLGESVMDLLPLLEVLATDHTATDYEDRLDDVMQHLDVEFLAEELPPAIDEAVDGLGRMGRLVGAVKEFAHPGTGEKVPTDLNRLIQNTVEVSRNEWKYVADIDLDLDPELPAVPLEPDQVRQVVLNLIVNAAQAIGEQSRSDQGTIRIRTQVGDEGVEVVVSDDGPGIPAAIIDHIWDPFFTTKEVGVGSGQGLAIARSIVVDKHDGKLSVETTAGQGSTFVMALPLRSREARAVGATAEVVR